MATRRCLSAIARHGTALLSSNSRPIRPLKGLTSFHHLLHQRLAIDPAPRLNPALLCARGYFSRTRIPRKSRFVEKDESEEDDDDEEEDSASTRAYYAEKKFEELSHIGYKVIGSLNPSEDVFKPYVPVYAVVQIGSHQFKVSNGDLIYVEKLKHCDINDKLILTKVLMLGSRIQTIIGRPILKNAAVHAVVEEHAMSAKVIIFKKKRRKNYRRCRLHRQELTRLRITDIQGIEVPGLPPVHEKKAPVEKKAEGAGEEQTL